MAIFKSCCGCCSLRTGSMIIAILGMIGSLLYTILLAIALSRFSKMDIRQFSEHVFAFVLLVVALIIVVLSGAIAIILLAGAIKRNRTLLLIWLVIQEISLFAAPIAAVILLVIGNVAQGVGQLFGFAGENMCRLHSCCLCCSLRTGVIILASGALAFLTISLVVMLWGHSNLIPIETARENSSHSSGALAVTIGTTVLLLGSIVLWLVLLMGAIKRKAKFLLPWMMISGMTLPTGLVVIIYQLYSGSSAVEVSKQIITTVLVALQLFLVYSHYREIKEEEEEEGESSATASTAAKESGYLMAGQKLNFV